MRCVNLPVVARRRLVAYLFFSGGFFFTRNKKGVPEIDEAGVHHGADEKMCSSSGPACSYLPARNLLELLS